MKEKFLQTKILGKALGTFLFLFLGTFAVNAQCLADAAAIEITGTGATAAEICAGDGMGDPIDVSVVGVGVGANSGWVITDNATGEILALPPAPPFDLDGAGDGVCDIWYIRYEDGLTGLMTGQNVSGLTGCFDLSNPISVTRNDPDAAAIEITGTGATAAEICAGDGVGDPIDVSVVGTGVGANSGWVITDNATGEILALPPAPPFDLDGAGDGVCDIWYIRYEDGLTGLMTGQNVSGLTGCFDLSNPISVTRNDPDAAAIEITGSGGATTAEICAGDGVGDPIDVSVVGTGVGANSGWVITDNATGEILALPPAPPFDLDGAGDGVCDIWYIRYEDGLTGLMTGQNVSGLTGCFDLSNPISVTRNDPDAAAIEITGSGGATEIEICAGDGVGDPIDVTVVGTGVGANSGWVITDNATGEILALPPAPPFDLDGAGDGVCDIWYIRYEDGLTGLMTGQNVSGLSGCFDLSNPISVTRNDPDAAAIEITGSGGATTAEICAGDGVGDPIDVTVVGTGVGANSGWVITDNATGEILALPPAPPFDLDGAGDGVCDIWYIRYEDGLTGLMTGQNVSGLTGCFDLSNPISVTRNDPDAAAIEITGSGGATEIEICAGDGVGDPIDVTVVGTGVGANSGWVITDNATGEILALPPAPPFDLDGAGDGVCDIWYIRYEDGLTGLMTGQNVSGLTGCFDLSNPISVTRNDPDAAAIEITGSGGATEIEICAGDGVGDPIDVTVVGTGVGANSGWVITDNASGEILALPPAPPFDFEGAGDGICDIWYIRYEDGLTGLMTGQNVADLTGCFDLSNPVTVDRQGVDAAAIEIAGTGMTSIDICAGDGIGDPIDVTVVGTGVGTNSGWVITDNATGTILALPAAPPFDLEGAGDGVCDIWYIRYEDGLTGLNTGQNVADLTGCFDLSNPISVNREGVSAAPIFITGSPGNTEITICAGDGVDNPINITVDGTGIGANSGWVITDNATGEILALPPAPPFNLDGAGPGVCDIWYIRYGNGLSGLEVGENVTDLDGCFDFSNPVTVNRQGVDAAAIEIAGTGTTEIDICAGDGIEDPIDVAVIGEGQGSFSGWVITDNATGEILALPPAPPFNLEGAGPGVCDIWYIRYESGLTGLSTGNNVGDLTGCFDLSNPITVNREGVDAAAIQIAGTTDTEVSICAGDGEPDPIDVEIVGTTLGANGGWVITDNATGEILALPAAPPFDLDGAGPGVCDIWYIRYADGLSGLETGQNVADLDGCFDLSNPIAVTRLTGDDCEILSTNDFQNTFEFSMSPNPANNNVGISFMGGQTVNAEVSFYDITGRLVLQGRFDSQAEISLDVSSLNSGTYLVQIQDRETGSNTTKQLIKR